MVSRACRVQDCEQSLPTFVLVIFLVSIFWTRFFAPPQGTAKANNFSRKKPCGKELIDARKAHVFPTFDWLLRLLPAAFLCFLWGWVPEFSTSWTSLNISTSRRLDFERGETFSRSIYFLRFDLTSHRLLRFSITTKNAPFSDKPLPCTGFRRAPNRGGGG